MKKRTGVVCLAFVLLAGTLVAPADAAKRKPKKVTREAEATYQLPYLGSPSSPVGGCIVVFGVGNPCPSFRIFAKERWVTMEVEDASGTPSAFEIRYKSDPNSTSTTAVGGPFCGSSGEQPVKLPPGSKIGVFVYAFGDVVCPGAVGTTGTVTAVFSRVP